MYVYMYVYICAHSAFILIEYAFSPRRVDPCDTMRRSDVYHVTATRDAREEQAEAILVTEIYSSLRIPHLIAPIMMVFHCGVYADTSSFNRSYQIFKCRYIYKISQNYLTIFYG